MALLNNLREKGIVIAGASPVIVDAVTPLSSAAPAPYRRCETTAAAAPTLLPVALAPPFAAAACTTSRNAGDDSSPLPCCNSIFYCDPYGNWACQACEPPARLSMIRRRAIAVILRRLPDDPIFGLPAYECGWADPDAPVDAQNATSAAGSGRGAARRSGCATEGRQRANLELAELTEFTDNLADWTEIPPEVERRWELFDRGLGGRLPRPPANDYPFSPSWIATADQRIAELKEKRAAERAAKAKNKKSGSGK